MVQGFVTLKEVLRQMDGIEPFDLTFVTYDKRRKLAGDIVQVQHAYGSGRRNGGHRNKLLKGVREDRKHKSPNHYVNSTRNVILNGSQVRKVHIRLITHFNGKQVIW